MPLAEITAIFQIKIVNAGLRQLLAYRFNDWILSHTDHHHTMRSNGRLHFLNYVLMQAADFWMNSRMNLRRTQDRSCHVLSLEEKQFNQTYVSDIMRCI